MNPALLLCIPFGALISLSALVRLHRTALSNRAVSASPFSGQLNTAGETPKGDPFRQPFPSAVSANNPRHGCHGGGARLISVARRNVANPLMPSGVLNPASLGLLLGIAKAVRKV